MPLLRFALVGGARTWSISCGCRPRPAPGIVSVSMEQADHRKAVVALATRCWCADPESKGRFAPAGLLAELNGRPGREVHAWLAWDAGTAASTATHAGVDDAPLGLVALVAARGMLQPRFSIAWLIVHPDARRRGIATALVTHAVAHAESLGATRIHAETLSSWPAAVGFWRRVGFEEEA